jgi:hypothetical protein
MANLITPREQTVSARVGRARTEDAMTRENRFPLFGETVPARRRPGLFQDLLGGTVIIAAWVLLWTFFALAVVEPAARFRASATAAGGAFRPVAGQVL